ncbi:alkaline phosphatase family protein [Actinoplanes sp. CA-142083]|uniref:alkaline phosphatase family protein n=1 Tax=Actinoplanes sp. CA-142083 TaxID=3239903 RepID=UPI003D94DBA5
MTFRLRARSALVLLAAVIIAGACQERGSAAPDHGNKVMIIVEENHAYGEIAGNPSAAYLNRLAADYGAATGYDAGYPARCPSLAAYILLTSGSTHGICDDKDPKSHPLAGDNVFRQVGASGREWRGYAEAAHGDCELTSHGRYLVRHVPATYYRGERADCRRWTVPLGIAGGGVLHDDLAAGALPALSFVSPDACDDMHGGPGCPRDLVAAGDRWLRTWLPRIMSGPDYRSGRLTVIVTWDEGTPASNHIPTVVVAPAVRHVVATQPLTHCSTLRFVEEQLRLPLLGCAAAAASLGPPFGL